METDKAGKRLYMSVFHDLRERYHKMNMKSTNHNNYNYSSTILKLRTLSKDIRIKC